jgi:hypothetical protein
MIENLVASLVRAAVIRGGTPAAACGLVTAGERRVGLAEAPAETANVKTRTTTAAALIAMVDHHR